MVVYHCKTVLLLCVQHNIPSPTKVFALDFNQIFTAIQQRSIDCDNCTIIWMIALWTLTRPYWAIHFSKYKDMSYNFRLWLYFISPRCVYCCGRVGSIDRDKARKFYKMICFCICFSHPSDECFDDIQAIVQQWKAVETTNDSQSKLLQNLLNPIISCWPWLFCVTDEDKYFDTRTFTRPKKRFSNNFMSNNTFGASASAAVTEKQVI